MARLRAQVDDVVKVTNANAAASYSALVAALNSGHYGYTVTDSIIMYRITGSIAYLQQAITMVDKMVDSENALIAAGSRPVVAADSYLEVGAIIEQVALTYDYGYAQLTAAQRSKWAAYAEQAVWNIWNYNSAKWGNVAAPWTGWSVNDPGNNYHYSFLRATMLWALASQSSGWRTFLEANKFPPLQSYFASLPGGGTREGTGYGTAVGNLFEDYQYWKASTGVDLSTSNTHAQNTIDYWIHASTPDFKYSQRSATRRAIPRAPCSTISAS